MGPDRRKSPWVIAAAVYALLILSLGAYLNYMMPYDPEPALPDIWQAGLWGLLYLPVLVLPVFAGWPVRDFGFSLRPALLTVAALLALQCSLMTAELPASLPAAITEAAARTGEEIFFRGFLFLLLLKMFETKRRPWLWAAVGSSTAFALVHTQTFQPAFLAGYSTAVVPYKIAERLLNVFLIGLLFAVLRQWTGSVLPGAIAHSVLQGGPLALPFVLLIYTAILFWARSRKENILAGFGREVATET